MKNLSLPFCLILFLLFSCNSPGPQPVKKQPTINKMDGVFSAEKYKELLPNGYTLIDVRTAEEYNEGFIENAINYDFYADNFLQNFNQFDKEKPMLIYCRSGGRSGQTYTQLKELGFKQVVDLKGGYSEWPYK